MTLLVSWLFPLDEYLSNLTVGCIMNPLFDKFHTSRAKLAYLLNATAAPLCVLIPLSSWTALLISLFEASGINQGNNATITASAFSLYIKTIPFMFYPMLSIAATWIIVQSTLSFSAMKKVEQTNNNEAAKDCPSKTVTGSITSFFLPMIVFIASLLILLIYTGVRAAQVTGTVDIITIVQNMKPLISLFTASLIACIVTSIYLSSHAIMSIKNIANQALCGFCEMLAPISVLLLAWIFSDIINVQLHTGDVVAAALLKGLPLFLIPAILFLIALIISASTGTSWGTLMILTPLAIPLVIQTAHIALIANFNALLLPALGSIISGSVAGGHLSPFHDLVILASTSTKIDPLLHIKTMIPYAAAPIVGALSGFLCAGYLALHNFTTPNICMLSISIGLVVTAGLLALFNKIL
jgi:Na+/H+ antiporter NhaC